VKDLDSLTVRAWVRMKGGPPPGRDGPSVCSPGEGKAPGRWEEESRPSLRRIWAKSVNYNKDRRGIVGMIFLKPASVGFHIQIGCRCEVLNGDPRHCPELPKRDRPPSSREELRGTIGIKSR